MEAQETKAGAFLYEISITNNSDSLSKISSGISRLIPSANQIEKRNQCLQYQRKKDGANYARMTDDEILDLDRTVLIPKGKTESIFVTIDRSESCQNLIREFSLIFYRPTFADNAQTRVRDLNSLFKIGHFFLGEVGVKVGDTRKFSLSKGFDSQSSGITPSWGGSEVDFIDLIGLSTSFHIKRNDGVRLDISTNEHCDFKKQQSNPCKIDFQINDNPKS